MSLQKTEPLKSKSFPNLTQHHQMQTAQVGLMACCILLHSEPDIFSMGNCCLYPLSAFTEESAIYTCTFMLSCDVWKSM